MSARSWFILLLPTPFVALIAFLTSSVQLNPAANAANAVHHAIEVARTTEGDLFQQGIRDGINYGALNAVRDQLTENYALRVGEIEPNSSQTFILADFDNGAWVNCRALNDQLSFCYDALPPYTIGLSSLISGEPPPEDCLTCTIRTSDEWATWLRGQSESLGPDPQIERLAQWGGYVLMRIAAADGDYAIQCRFDKMTPVQLEMCWEE
jgi:hypothetical protein